MQHPPEPGAKPVTHTFKLVCQQDYSEPQDRGVLTGWLGDGEPLLTCGRRDRQQLAGHLLEQGSARRNRTKIDFVDTDGMIAFTWHKVAQDVCKRCQALRPHVRRDWHDSRILLCVDCWDAQQAQYSPKSAVQCA